MQVYELTEIMRQGPIVFQQLLNRVREGKQTEADVRVLQSTDRNLPLTQPHLMYTNASKNRHNPEVIESERKAGNIIHTFTAVDEVLALNLTRQHKEKVLERGSQTTGSRHSSIVTGSAVMCRLVCGVSLQHGQA